MSIRSRLLTFVHGPGDGKSRFRSVSSDGVTVTSDDPFTIWEGMAMMAKAKEDAATPPEKPSGDA